VTLSRFQRGLLAVLAAGLLALFVVRPGANRLRARLVNSIGNSLGRQVEIGHVSLRVLPRPGFDLEQFVVHDDPAFSAEPVLRAGEVTALLRLSSLFRGRIEIARLSLKEPSFNLVRADDGHWNLEPVLERTARTPAAPTGKTTAEARPRFPYIEADNGRINFKIGQAKKAYALTEADFALWLDSENQWAMRLQARPVRTDFNLSDTGTLRVNGTWHNADQLRHTSLQFDLALEGAQLGQLTKLAYGDDKGWRGGVEASATLTGTPADLLLKTQASVQDFRRYDIMASPALRLAAGCTAHYASTGYALSQISCQVPVASGGIALAGSVTGLPQPHTYALTLTATRLPMQAWVDFARHAKKGLAADLSAAGTLNAEFSVLGQDAAIPVWSGEGQTSGFILRSGLLRNELALGRIPFAIASAKVAPTLRKRPAAAAREREQLSAGTALEVGPFPVSLAKSGPATGHAWLTRSAYGVSLEGDAQLQRLLQLARTLGFEAPQLAADGLLKVDLQVAGQWSGFAAPQATGTAQLRSVRAEIRGLNAPLEIASASLTFSPDEAKIQNLKASVADLDWTGSISRPRNCASSAACWFRFDLHTDQLSTGDLAQLLNPHPKKRPWYRRLSSDRQSGGPALTGIRAQGKLSTDRLVIKGVAATRVSAEARIEEGKLRLTALQGDFLGGRHTGEWQADFRVTPPAYTATGRLEHASLSQLATAMHDDWATGSAKGRYKVTLAGWTAAELLGSAKGTLEFDWRDGSLPRITLGGTPLRLRRFLGRLTLDAGTLNLSAGKLESPGGIYGVSGSASLARDLDFKLVRDTAHAFSVTGTIAAPLVAPIPSRETQAALKP
jgi:hypothetical protein